MTRKIAKASAILVITASAVFSANSSPSLACWDEPNSAMPNGYEHICGATNLMPSGSINITDYPRSY